MLNVKKVSFNINEFLMGVSIALDLAEKEILNVDINHSKRVAYLSVKIAIALKMTPEECFDIVSYAIFHDNGLTEAVLKYNLGDYKDNELSRLENIKEHCEIGERNIENFPFLTKQRNIILYHHEYYDGSGFFHKKANEIPLMSRIINLCDEIDFNFNLSDISFQNKQNIIKFIIENKTKRFDPILVDTFIELSSKTSFWMDMQETSLIRSINNSIKNFSLFLTWEEIFDITKIFSLIIDTKSKFTYNHTGGLVSKIEKMANFYNFDNEKIIKLKIAASLHDLGKLAIPNEILEKDSDLNKEEFDRIKIHTYLTNFALQDIESFKDINKWAYSHHEKLDGKGYPFGLTADELGFEERLMGCLDIYQALTEIRPYRNNISHEEAMKIMYKMVHDGKIDEKITKDIDYFFKF